MNIVSFLVNASPYYGYSYSYSSSSDDVLVAVLIICGISAVVGIGMGLLWGFVSRSIVRSKGYPNELNHGFAWGFWLGLIGLIVCACKKEYMGYQNGMYINNGYQGGYQNNGYQGGYQNNGYQGGYQNNGYQDGGFQNNMPNPSAADELRRYKDLLDSGAISQQEYNEIRQKLINKM